MLTIQEQVLLICSSAGAILVIGLMCLAASSAIDIREWPGIFWIILAGPEAWHRCRKILENRQPRIPMEPAVWVDKRYRRDLRAALAVEQERLRKAQEVIESVRVAQEALIASLESHRKLGETYRKEKTYLGYVGGSNLERRMW